MGNVTDKLKRFEKDLLFSQFTLENLHEAVFWIDANANIFRVNDMASQMTGYTKEELLKKTVPDLNPTIPITGFDPFWKQLKKEKKTLQPSQMK